MHADVPNHEPSLLLMNCGDGPADPAEPGLVADLRPGHREPEPARLHRHVPRRLPDPGDAELAGRLPARRLPGHVHRHAAHRRSSKLIEHIRNDRVAAAEQRAAARPAAAAQRAAPADAGSDDAAARGPHPVVRAGLPHADRGGRRVRRQPRAAAHPRHVRPRRAGPADC